MTDPIERSYLSAAGREELPALTGLRILAALAVTVWHAAHFMPALVPPFTHGYLGVDLFFMLSGFIIAHVYWGDFQQPTRRTYPRFVALRLARLWPAHVVMIVAFLFTVVFVGRLRGLPFPDFSGLRTELVLHFFLAQNWGPIPRTMVNFPSWSVSAEFLAYLLFPLNVLLLRRIASPWALAAIVPLFLLLCFVLMELVLHVPLSQAGPSSNVRVLGEFAMGVALWRVWRSQRFAALPWGAIVGACALGIVLISALTPQWHVADYLIVLLMAPLLLGLAQGGNAPARLLAVRPMVYLGEISYSIYLVHALAISLTRGMLPLLDVALDGRRIGWDVFALALLLSIGGGALLFHLVEKPARLWLRARIDRHLPGLHPAAA